MLDLYIQYGTVVLGLLLSALAWGAIRLVMAKVKSLKIRDILFRFGTELRSVVLEVNQTYVKALKEASADGKLTDEEKKEALERAIKKLKSNLGMNFLKKLARILGLSSVEEWLVTQAESMVAGLKPPKA